VHVLSPGQKVAIYRERSATPAPIAQEQARTVAATEGGSAAPK
jgi:hypothetical protein